MYKILAIDTSTDACSAALLIGNELLTRKEVEPRAHTRLILPMINSLLKEANITFRALDALAFGQGPGSFTGLRIACSVIQGLSFGLQKPVVPISSLRALAEKAHREYRATHVMASLDARMQEIYWGLFALDENGIMQSISAERLQTYDAVQLPEGAWFEATGFPEARDIATLAASEFAKGHFVSAELALPVYIRNDVVRHQ